MTNNRLEQAYQDIGLFWISAVQLALTRGILNFNLIFPDRKQLSSSLTDFCLFFTNSACGTQRIHVPKISLVHRFLTLHQ